MTNKRDKRIGNGEGPSSTAFAGPVKNGFLFVYPSLNQRMQLLQRLVSDGEFLTLVVGEHASGKSMLIRNFLFHNSGQWQACRIRMRPMVHTHNRTLLKHFQNLSAFRLDNNRQYVLILDDAHHLSLEALQLLIRGAQKSESNLIRIGIVLLGEPQIKQMIDRLADELPPTTAVTTLYMPALDEEQTKAYLQRRLQIHDHLEQFKFSDKQVRYIYQASAGLPGRINQEANKILDGSQGKGNRSKRIDQKSRPNQLRT
jgi:DamX protein